VSATKPWQTERETIKEERGEARRTRLRLRWTLGVALLGVLILIAGPARLAEAMSHASPRWILVVACLACVWLLLGALNVWLLLRQLTPVSFGLFARAYVASWAASLVIPGQLGDVTQVILLRRAGVPAASSAASYLLDKMVSLAWLSLIAAYGLAQYTPYHPGIELLLVLLVALSAGVGLRLLLRVESTSRPWLLRGQSAARRAIEQLRLFRARPAAVATNCLLTAMKWLTTAALYLAAFRAVGTTIGFEAAATIPVMSSLVGYVPLTIAGLGSMELTAVALFGTLGVQPAKVLSAYLLLRAVLVLGAAFLLGGMELGKSRKWLA
jgi:uncharacterized protein (TIRG00374 family)